MMSELHSCFLPSKMLRQMLDDHKNTEKMIYLCVVAEWKWDTYEGTVQALRF